MSVLAIDAGTTGVTALVVRADGTVAARGYQEFRQYYPHPGWVEHLPEDIWQATLAASRQALGRAAGKVSGGENIKKSDALFVPVGTLMCPAGK